MTLNIYDDDGCFAGYGKLKRPEEQLAAQPELTGKRQRRTFLLPGATPA